jgi:predicted nucleic acid-binding protein
MWAAAYLDASAAVKLLVAEAESDALAARLNETALWISAEILDVELGCFVHRRAAAVLVDRSRLLSKFDLLALTPAVRERAAAPFMPPQRALDAIHLATALHVGIADMAFVSYDRQQLAAAEAGGLACLSPA